MLPLSGDAAPTTSDELTAALRHGLEKLGITPHAIEAEGSDFPRLSQLRVDLTAARVSRDFRPPQPGGANNGAVSAAQFDLVGAPIYFEETPLEVRLSATAVQGHMEMRGGGIVVESAGAGDVEVQIEVTALEALVHGFAVEAARQHGLEVRKTKLTFTQIAPREIAFRAEVTAKVFVMSAQLALTGRVVIDDAMNARISQLALDGDGMVLKLAAGFARPHLDRLEGRAFPLLSFAPAGLKLRNIELTAGSTLQARAQFGSA